jgi:hypothetical protein
VTYIRLAVIAGCLAFLGSGNVASGQAPPFDSSGNGLLSGTYYFREVIYVLADQSGTFGRALAVYGNINFDGAGKYTLSGTNVFDSNAGVPQVPHLHWHLLDFVQRIRLHQQPDRDQLHRIRIGG